MNLKMNLMEERNPKIFISYSHDSKEHQDKVLLFSNRLRSEGIDCSLDQYEDSPPEGWPKWMDRKVKDSDFILVICTEKYYNKVLGSDEKGMGIKWESTLIYQHLYNGGSNNTKFIPVIFNDGNFNHIPEILQGATFYNVDNATDYDKLYWRLRGVKADKPELGKLRQLPNKERKTLFFSGLLDQESWENANWRNGVHYLYASEGELPPVFTILFENLELGVEIFKDLIEQVGTVDQNERIRLSIIEGEVPNQEHGYYVTIGENTDAIIKLLRERGLYEEVKYVAYGQRVHRIKQLKDSKNLEDFKREYNKYGCYHIAPAQQLNDPEKGIGTKVELNYKILKRKIEFRNYKDIEDFNDPDSIVKSYDLKNDKENA
jgi:hypothetical protein